MAFNDLWMSLNSLYTDADRPRLKPPGVGKKPKKRNSEARKYIILLYLRTDTNNYNKIINK